MKILSAEYVLPISAKPIINGAVAINKDKISVVGKKKEIVERFPEARHIDLGESVILPGFVNCHSHIELTIMRGFLDDFDDDFSSWLIKLTKTRANVLTDEDIKLSAMLGAYEGVRSGVTCFGDIGRWGEAGFEALKSNGLRGVLYQETEFAPDDKDAEKEFNNLISKFQQLKKNENELVKVGISPHAPYTVSRRLFELITSFAIENRVDLTIHTSESKQEQSLIERGDGFFADIYKKENVTFESPQSTTVEYFNNIGVLAAEPLLAHCVQVSENDIELIKKSNAKIAHCPKSNAKFGHGIAPLKKFLNKGINVGFGTDSMASNNNCDILEESRFAALFARTKLDSERFIKAEEIIKTSTLGGATALGLENIIGTLEAGKQADIINISIETVAQMPVHDIYNALLFATNSANVKMTMVAGEILFQDGISSIINVNDLKRQIQVIQKKMI